MENKKVDNDLTLAFVADELAKHIDRTRIWVDGSVMMTKAFVVSVGNLEIHVYRDHYPAHFHVISKQRGINARFRLDNCELLSIKSGEERIKSDDIKKVKAFFGWYPDMLEFLRKKHEHFNKTDS